MPVAGMMAHMGLLQQLSFQAAAAQAVMPGAMAYGAGYGVGGGMSAVGPQVEARSPPWVKYRCLASMNRLGTLGNTRLENILHHCIFW